MSEEDAEGALRTLTAVAGILLAALQRASILQEEDADTMFNAASPALPDGVDDAVWLEIKETARVILADPAQLPPQTDPM